MGKRLLSLDLIKLIAMFGVVCLHTEMNFYDNPIAQFLYMTAVVSIPLFFMTSGYLLYGKSSVDCKYSSRKIIGIIRFVAIITVAFWLITGYRHGTPFLQFTLGSLLQWGGLGIFWYFGAMIIIYALLPLFHKLYVSYPRGFVISTVLLFLVANGIFFANFLDIHVEQHTIQTFRLWNWIFYFNVGGLVRRYQPKVKGLWVLLLVLFNYMFQYELTPMMPTIYCEYFYCSIPVMLLSASLFCYLLNISNNRLQLINGGGKLFLPVYAFHTYVIGKTITLFEHYVYVLSSNTAPLFWVLVSLLSVTLAWVIMKIPYMDKVFKI